MKNSRMNARNTRIKRKDSSGFNEVTYWSFRCLLVVVLEAVLALASVVASVVVPASSTEVSYYSSRLEPEEIPARTIMMLQSSGSTTKEAKHD